MQEIEKIFSDESMFSEMDALDIHSKKIKCNTSKLSTDHY
jgi:hypothetical protein